MTPGLVEQQQITVAAAPSPESRRERLLFIFLGLGWLVAALGFAAVRLPFDDEWGWIKLARDMDWSQFWWSLGHDCHPPLPSLLDRGVLAAGAPLWALNLLRLLAAALAIGLVSRVLERRWGVRRWQVVLAAFHPIVFMYSGAVRWYPYVFLAQALRCWAIWGAAARGRQGAVALIAGSAIGPACGYLDLPFALLDALWYIITASRPRRREIFVGAAAGIATVAAWVASVIALDHWALFARTGNALGVSLKPVGLWLGSGLMGEAVLPWPWTLLALPAAAILLVAAARALTCSRPLGAWLGCIFLGWMAVATTGKVLSPRYSLLTWVVLTASLIPLARWRLGGRLAAGLAATYLLAALALTVNQRHSLKADLNELAAGDCAALLPWPEAELIVVPYPRTAAEIQRVCRPGAPVVEAHWFRNCPTLDEVVAPIARALPGKRTVVLVTLRTRSSLSITNRHTRKLLAARGCRREETRRVLATPHLELRQRLGVPPENPRYQVERWRCGVTRGINP